MAQRDEVENPCGIGISAHRLHEARSPPCEARQGLTALGLLLSVM